MTDKEKEQQFLYLKLSRWSEILSYVMLGEFVDQLFINLAIGHVTAFAVVALIDFAGFVSLQQLKDYYLKKVGIVDEESRKNKLKELSGRDV